jgi:hypothetical protein
VETVVGHRGRQGPRTGTNENTLRALRSDRHHGVRFETDVWNLAARDGTPNAGPPAIFHDSTLGRVVSSESLAATGLTSSTYIGDVTRQQFSQLRTKGGQPLPLAHAWINHAGKWHVRGLMEIKYAPQHPERFARWVREARAGVTVYASPHLYDGVCHQTAMTELRDAGLKVGLKVSRTCPVSLSDAAAFGYRVVVGPVTASYVEQAHALGLRVGNYDSGRVSMWIDLINAGADFIIAPHPAVLQQWLVGTPTTGRAMTS